MNVGISAQASLRREHLVYARDLVREMVFRDVRGKYKRSALGVAWAMLNPLSYLLVFYFVFQVVLDVDTPRFTAYALVGLLIWGWSAGALSQAASAITANGALLRQPGFATGLLPPITVATHLVYLLMAFPPLLIFLLLEGSRPGWSLSTLPLIVAVQFVFTLTLAYLLAAANTYFRDTEHLTNILLRLTMFISPIFYETARVPEAYQPLYQLNPLVPLLDAYRAVFMYGTQPPWVELTAVGLISAASLYFSVRLYRYAATHMVDDL